MTERRAAITPVVLSGGAGTRLWPLSSEARPKQFLPLVSSRTLFQETLLRLEHLVHPVRPPVVVCNELHRLLAAEQLEQIDARPQAIVLEPVARNTAPAVAAAALVARAAADADPLILVLPADHVIANVDAFARAVCAAIEAASAGNLVTFGVVPTHPETGYGYIQQGRASGSWARVQRFVEKPDYATAQRYVDSGEYFWNSGMFLFSAETYLDELRRHAPEMHASVERAVASAERAAHFTRLGEAFGDCSSSSIDYTVMEKTTRAAMVPLDAGWSDVGSWSALHDVLARDSHGNALRGTGRLHACRNTYVSSSGRMVAAVGLENVIIVETPECVLVLARDHAQDVKKVAEDLQRAAATSPRPNVSEEP